MPACVPQIAFSSVHVSQTSTVSDTFTVPSDGLYRITINASVYADVSYPSMTFGGVITDGVGGSVNFQTGAYSGPSHGTSASSSYVFFFTSGQTVTLSSTLTGSPTYNTQFIVEQLV